MKSEERNQKETPSATLEMLRTAVRVVSSFFPLNQTLLLSSPWEAGDKSDENAMCEYKSGACVL